jgi:hypothetical protein
MAKKATLSGRAGSHGQNGGDGENRKSMVSREARESIRFPEAKEGRQRNGKP